MRESAPISQLLYVSRLAPGMAVGVVKDIVRAARRHNPARSITGALLFNGDHFCQLLEGPPEHVRELKQRITDDRRHTDMRVHFEGVSSHPARLALRWRSGYCEPAAFDAFEPLDAPGAGAIGVFLRLMREADLE